MEKSSGFKADNRSGSLAVVATLSHLPVHFRFQKNKVLSLVKKSRDGHN